MAPGVGWALVFKYVSSGLLCGGRQQAGHLELDVAGGLLGKAMVERSHDGTAFGVSGHSGNGPTTSW